MTLKQRRHQRELIARLDELKRNIYYEVPKGYVFGENLGEDEKYNEALASFKSVVEALHKLEMQARDGD